MRGPASITEVRVRTLKAPLDEPVVMACGEISARTTVLVEVERADGLVGIGESWSNHPHWVAAERTATLIDGIAPLLLGEDSRHIAALHAKLARSLSGPARQWGGQAPLLQAVSGVDIALWDLAGRSLGVGVADLIGGRYRDRVPAYASGLGPDRVEDIGAACLEAGWDALKVRVGFDPDLDRSNLQAARRILGPGRLLAADANQGWQPGQARRMARTLGDVGVAWIEEPIADASLEELDGFAAVTGLTVALGENLAGSTAFLAYLGSSDRFLLQPDITKVGGFSHAWPVCQLAGVAGVAVAPHFYGGGIGWAATLQLAAACPAIRSVEYDIRPNRLRDDLLAQPPAVAEGTVQVPAGPGLGVSLDGDAVDRYTTESRRRTL
ncbi:MAG TPA: mandelate racemase/muconate lactonizing enzyme family protein [Acidimicrobiales bacterium]|nr:mandelate racemase/muconate lactonizing enzyme family protein [Acidimicrobiales bacterium]